MNATERLNLLKSNAMEIVTEEELVKILKDKESPVMYVGLEPSGFIHIGTMIVIRKLIDFREAGFTVNVLLADWHAMLNDKLDGDLEKIKRAGMHMRNVFESFGVDANFIWASDLIEKSDYWATVLKIAKSSTISRIKRAMTIMGRKEGDADADVSKMIYPCMQVADIFKLGVDVAYAGMDQRKAHMLARDVSDKYGWKKVVALHTPILSGLKGSMRMDSFEGKMSKSNPEAAVLVTDSDKDIERKILKAYCPEKKIEDNPIIEIIQYLILPWIHEFRLIREDKYGGAKTYNNIADLREDYQKGLIHPMDLKISVKNGIISILEIGRDKIKNMVIENSPGA
ncbi:MAG: tyrosine--tRNA ligase [Candidatus Thermoplasmatota archaeon]|jgi:tyrosyl-tRNA synthetase|nr:tyrosine--tRNA ligase [Candidatus Thermoplasmatota archaeon]MCL5963870.1 tyrosine--tRNA ligase [Candidatus Thermoplasmatota archaeon]